MLREAKDKNRRACPKEKKTPASPKDNTTWARPKENKRIALPKETMKIDKMKIAKDNKINKMCGPHVDLQGRSVDVDQKSTSG